ncbi:MAG: hypothetical protein ABSD99_04865, partial [Candidatus Bathyarchaeia archaeon]
MAALPTFFDLITLIGVAAFFGWLAFAPLQADQLEKYDHYNLETRAKARRNLNAVNDYFAISFMFFVISACSDYLVNSSANFPLGNVFRISGSAYPFYHHAQIMYLLVAFCFVAGIVMLAAPM